MKKQPPVSTDNFVRAETDTYFGLRVKQTGLSTFDQGEREVACPNQDVVYGGGPLALDVSPVVIQVPDFGDRFWVYQVVDIRTDSFASLGKMPFGTSPFQLGPTRR